MYYLLYIFCYLISLLPLRILYLISDGLYLLLYHVAGYRKKVVLDNLSHALPEKTAVERAQIARKYYRHLADMMVETLKLLSANEKFLKKHFNCDLSILHELLQNGKSCQLHLGHRFNWEWANLYFRLGITQPFLVTYMPLSNKAADRLFMRLRARFGSIMIPANDVQQAMQPWQDKNYVSVLVADQNPGKARRSYWAPFLHRMTAFYKGPELSARRYDIPVVFGDIVKVKRGHYKAFIRLAFEHPQQTTEGEVTRAFAAFLEECILQQPETWTWSHRRWKHQWKGAPGSQLQGTNVS